jgi:secreted PhoX family phosphatase
VPNASGNAYFGDVVEGALGRRSLLKGGLAALVVAGVGVQATDRALAAPGRPGTGVPASTGATNSGTGLRFEPIPPTDATVDAVIVPRGYASDVLIRWGDPVLPGATPLDEANQTGASQAGQFGYNCDFIGFVPFAVHGNPSRPGGSDRGTLTVNHEYTEPDRMFPGYVVGAPTRDQVEAEWAAHGLSVIEIERQGRDGTFTHLPGSGLNRRITATTPMAFSGPAAGDALLQTSADPTGTTVLGTLNNCAGGVTPWGTILSAEENVNQYFANRDALPAGRVKDAHNRYGLPRAASERRWELFDRRFDLAQEPNEPFRFGWIVEVDPEDPTSTPVKHTALGRFKHEAATVHIAPDGRVVAYSGDDERFDYVYKFVSRGTYRPGDKAHNMTLLADGELFVARFTGDSPPAELERYNATATLGQLPEDGEFDGSGTWIPLTRYGAGGALESAVPGFTLPEVLILTRLAADAVGATKMDRPEDIERNPINGRVYMAMTNNTDRGRASSTNPRKVDVDEANPRRVDERGTNTGNKYGHIVELEEAGGDGTALTFAWRLFMVCGNPTDPTTYFAGFPREQVSPIAAPDNVAFDGNGNLWIGTDGQPGTIGRADAFHAVAVQGPERGRTRQFLSVPAGAEACAPEFTPDQRTLFCAVQHPGEGLTSHWPDGGTSTPKPSVIAVVRTTGDPRIGS